MGNLMVKTGFSKNRDEALAVAEAFRQIRMAGLKCVIFFVSSHYDQKKISEAIHHFTAEDEAFQAAEFVGCTSAGEFTERGFLQDSFTAIGFSSAGLSVGVGVGRQISEDPIGAAKGAVEEACRRLGIGTDDLNQPEYTGLVLIDGLRSAEEYVMLGINKAARKLRVAGGSAGDDFDFSRTIIHARGETYEDAVALIIFKTDVPVKLFQISSYLPTRKKLKITKADCENRIVYEFNGRPAADEYARALGIGAEKLNADVFMNYPLALSVEGRYYIRSPLKVVPEDRALMFFSNINEGTWVTIMSPGKMIEATRAAVRKIQQEIPNISAIISFNCILSYLQSAKEGSLGDLIRELSVAPLAGFNTYGEQYNGLHVNQTMTLIVFGSGK